MNLDLVLKLVRLANNNPNDNEANLAARRVCQMLATAIEKGELRWNVKRPVAPPVSRPAPAPTTWNDVQRSTEPQWSSRPPQDAGADLWDMINKIRQEEGNWWHQRWSQPPPFTQPPPRSTEQTEQEQQQQKTRTAGQQVNDTWDYMYGGRRGGKTTEAEEYARQQAKKAQHYQNYQPITQKRDWTKRERPEKRPLPCKDCKVEFQTSFVGHPSQFQCHVCYFNERRKAEEERNGTK